MTSFKAGKGEAVPGITEETYLFLNDPLYAADDGRCSEVDDGDLHGLVVGFVG